MQLNLRAVWATAVAIGGMTLVPLCQAQYPEDFRPLAIDGSIGLTEVHGADRANFRAGNSGRKLPMYQVGLAYAPGQGPRWQPDKNNLQPDKNNKAKKLGPVLDRFNLFVTGRFLYAGSKLTSLGTIATQNPQSPVLLSANDGRGAFYAATAGLRLQYSLRHAAIYVEPGGGWLRRSIALTGVNQEGTVLQPNNPAVFRQAGNSGVVGANGGIAIDVKGWFRVFGEVGVLQGMAINHGTRITPMLAGGLRW